MIQIEGVYTMDLYKEILMHILSQETVEIRFPDIRLDIEKIVSMECYQALRRIRDIIHDETLVDEECFSKIEEIICTLESMGSNGGFRHDFG